MATPGQPGLALADKKSEGKGGGIPSGSMAQRLVAVSLPTAGLSPAATLRLGHRPQLEYFCSTAGVTNSLRLHKAEVPNSCCSG